MGLIDINITPDLKEIKNEIKSLKNKISEKHNNKVQKEYKIAMIDDIYDKTGYIIEYGTVKVSKEELIQCVYKQWYNSTLKDFFGDYLIESSGELNGFELDTPNLEDFDFYIDFRYGNIRLVENKHKRDSQ